MKKNNLLKTLNSLQEVQARESLKKRIHSLEQSLPYGEVMPRMSLTMFRVAFAGIVVVLLLGLGSGVVAAAKGSHPGSLLYPLKKAIVQTQIKFTSNPEEKAVLKKEIEESTPSATPVASPTAKPVIKVKEHEDENEQEVEGVSTHVTVTPRVSISQHGEDDDQKKNILQKIFHHGDDDSSDN